VSNDVNERVLNEAFGKYPSYCKCKVVKDRLSLKVSVASRTQAGEAAIDRAATDYICSQSMLSLRSKTPRTSCAHGRKWTVSNHTSALLQLEHSLGARC
jgi:hypothetical protein